MHWLWFVGLLPSGLQIGPSLFKGIQKWPCLQTEIQNGVNTFSLIFPTLSYILDKMAFCANFRHFTQLLRHFSANSLHFHALFCANFSLAESTLVLILMLFACLFSKLLFLICLWFKAWLVNSSLIWIMLYQPSFASRTLRHWGDLSLRRLESRVIWHRKAVCKINLVFSLQAYRKSVLSFPLLQLGSRPSKKENCGETRNDHFSR